MELFATESNRVDARKVRSFTVGSQTEGCVVDDTAGVLYIAEEAVGIWKYGAEPEAGNARTPVDSAGGGHLVADIEGLIIADTGNGTGYLIASSQGDNSYVAVYAHGQQCLPGLVPHRRRQWH
jgi:3-phytase